MAPRLGFSVQSWADQARAMAAAMAERMRQAAAQATAQAAQKRQPVGHSPVSSLQGTRTAPVVAEPVEAKPDVTKMNQAQKYEYYKSLIEKVGTFDPSRPNVIGLRLPTRPDSAGNGRFDDVMVVLKDGKVYEFPANTEPAGRYSSRRSDLGQLAPNQQIEFQPFFNDSKYGDGFRPVGDPLVQRYDDGIDGRLGAPRRDGGGASMLFHTSFSNSDTGSMGCQTMRPADMDRFNAVIGGQKFTYTLTEVGADSVPNIDGSNADHWDGALSLEQMRQVFPSASEAQLKAHAPFVNQILKEMGATDAKSAAAVLATISVETGDLKWLEELGPRSAHAGYDGGADFKGRGYIHLTHRSNYAAASQAIFGDDRLVQNPDLAARPDVAAKVFTWYCKTHDARVGQAIAAGDIRETSSLVNTGRAGNWDGTNNRSERADAFNRAMGVLSGGFAGGYVANDSTPVDVSTSSSGSSRYAPRNGYTGSANTWYDPSQGSMPFAQDGTIDPAAIARPYSNSYSNFYALFMEMLWADCDWATLGESSEFEAWVKKQPFGANWKRGQPVPKELMAKFLAYKLDQKHKEGVSGPDAVRQIKEQFSSRPSSQVLRETGQPLTP